LRDAVVSRDATIAKLTVALGKAIFSSPSPTGAAKAVDGETAAQLVSDLRRRLTSEVAARARLAKRLGRLAESSALNESKAPRCCGETPSCRMSLLAQNGCLGSHSLLPSLQPISRPTSPA